MDLIFRKSQVDDHEKIKELYTSVAQNPRGTARNPSEITDAYVEGILNLNVKNGLSMVGISGSRIIAEIHAGTKGIQIFEHLLAFLTIGVDPSFQGKGVGAKMFNAFLEEVKTNRKDVYRVELESRAANAAAMKLYKKMGFVEEGRMVNQTRNLDGTHEDGIMMAWFNPAYEKRGAL